MCGGCGLVQGLSENHLFVFLMQIFLLLGLARGLGELFRKWKQPSLTAEILVGIVLGPTILGRLFPSLHQALFPKDVIQQSIFEIIAWLGMVFFLLETGIEVDFTSAWRQKGRALNIAISDLVVPMAIVFIPCFFLPERYLPQPDSRLIFTLFMATVMTISAMPVAARILYDLNLLKTDFGILVMSSLSIKDIAGWLIFALVLGLFREERLELTRVVVTLTATVGFTAVALTVGRNFTGFIVSQLKARRMPEPGSSFTFICLLGLLCGAITQRIGIHALFGFFVAGIMAGEARAFSEKTRQFISQMLYAIFVPIFFAGIGLRLDFLKSFDLFLVLFVAIVGIGARFLGAWLGARLTDIPRANHLPIAIAHTPGGAMEIVVALLALQYGLVGEPAFVAIVFGAVFSSVIAAPWLNHAIKRRKEIGVLEFFSRRAIVEGLRARTRDHAIHELCTVAVEQQNVSGDAEAISACVLESENLAGSAIEEGVAIPRGQCPSLEKPAVVFGRSLSGIEWNSPDGKSARLIFLVLTPEGEDDTQVQIIRLIVGRMKNPHVREALTQARDDRELWALLQESLASHNVIKK